MSHAAGSMAEHPRGERGVGGLATWPLPNAKGLPPVSPSCGQCFPGFLVWPSPSHGRGLGTHVSSEESINTLKSIASSWFPYVSKKNDFVSPLKLIQKLNVVLGVGGEGGGVGGVELIKNRQTCKRYGVIQDTECFPMTLSVLFSENHRKDSWGLNYY